MFGISIIPTGRIAEQGSLLVQLSDGSLVNVEIQRIGYHFPGARCACYSSDLVMRQYTQVREQMRKSGQKFSYRDIKKVYTIVLIQEYILILLDIFLKKQHNKPKKITDKLDANTVQLMVEEQQQIIENQKVQIAEKNSIIAEKDTNVLSL